MTQEIKPEKAPKRVYKLAQELGVSIRTLLNVCKQNEIYFKSGNDKVGEHEQRIKTIMQWKAI